MLHILDGDASAGTLKRTNVPGEKFAWREAFIEGPTPAGIEADEWRTLRAQHLSDHYSLAFEECQQRLGEQEATLQALGDHDEVVLWFEHDLFCQANLLYLLDWCSRNRIVEKTKLTLISIDQFPGIEDFRGLGQLNPEQLASLFDSRHVVTEAELETARLGWRAYSAAQPTELTAVLKNDLSSLPFAKNALELHLARFPSVRNGLGLVENTLMQLLAGGQNKFVDIFVAFGDLQPVYGFGDVQLWLALRRLSRGEAPLVNMAKAADGWMSFAEIRDTRFEPTAEGDDVLNNRADYIQLNGIDLWLGGVHLQGRKSIWRWDDETGVVVQS